MHHSVPARRESELQVRVAGGAGGWRALSGSQNRRDCWAKDKMDLIGGREMMTRFKIGRVALLSGCAFAGIIVPAHAQTAATATAEAQSAEDAGAPSAQDIIVTGTRVVRDGYNQPTPVTVAPPTGLEKATPPNLADDGTEGRQEGKGRVRTC